MNSLIMVMNKLQDVFSTIGSSQKVDLPQIVVVGSQSSGKSSVLESLVGKSFLPRGTGIVTRAPLVLHLINPSDTELMCMTDSKLTKDWATFLHKPNVIFTDFNKVRKEIELRTEELAGDKKNITEDQIVLNIYSKLLYNLSFVDLPGLTKVPVSGQPDDIEDKIRKLVLHFVENPNSIILAVVTANTDPATSESLHIAKAVDPSGDRTLAVVTKIDIMDAGTDAREFLCGEVIPVKLGIIGVINRSQKDINEQKSIKQSLEDERIFFQKRYPTLADQQGILCLGKKLEYLLIKKIKETYPNLKKQIFDMHNQFGAQLKQLKEFTDNYDRSLLDLITQTASSYKSSLDGNAKSSLSELNGGAKIANYFKTRFCKDIDEIDPLHGLAIDSIINVINNSSGTSMGVFMPSQAFDHLVKIQLRQMEQPSLSCVNYVHEELISTIYHLDDDILRELKKYPRLMEKIVEVLQNLLGKYKQKTIDCVTNMINYQEAYVNTGHPDFVDAIMNSEEYKQLFKQAIKPIEGKEQGFAELNPHNYESQSVNHNEKSLHLKGFQSWPSEAVYKMRQTVEKISTCVFTGFVDGDKLILESRAGLLSLFIKCYFQVIKKIIQDTIPKTIMHEMVNNVKNNFQKDLTCKIYKSKDLNIAELLLESSEIVDKRIKATNRYEAAVKALKLMREIEQYCLTT